MGPKDAICTHYGNHSSFPNSNLNKTEHSESEGSFQCKKSGYPMMRSE